MLENDQKQHASYETSTRVLIVDDDSAHAKGVAETLGHAGFPCTVANSGTSALSQIGSQKYDVIITELALHPTDGFEILRKSLESRPDAGVIVLTRQASIQSAVAAGQLGVCRYLTKPMDTTELRDAVRSASPRFHALQKYAETRWRPSRD